MQPSAPPDVPADVRHILQTLWSNGHAAYLVGGGVRDSLLGETRRRTGTSRPTRCPSETLSVFPGGSYKNRFGTVTVPRTDRPMRLA